MAANEPQSTSGDGHRFGGAWTEIKLDAVADYCSYFNKVLAQSEVGRNFERWYFDGFAGSGSRRVERKTGGLLDGSPVEIEAVDLDGSVLKALRVDPPFHRFALIEGSRTRFRFLEAIRAANADKDIRCLHGDVNVKLREVFGSPPWSRQRGGRGSCRGLCFLDPYGMNVDWATLKMLADTQAVDVWYLFPLEAVSRQLAGDLERVSDAKRRRLDEVFGTSDWRDDVYKQETTQDLFAEVITTTTRQFDRGQIERYAQARLRTIFCEVSEPLPLLRDQSRQIFSLFCLSNSASPKAIELIRNGVEWVLKKHGPRASRRKSGR